MSWRDELRDASFRFVDFKFRSTSDEGGRRVVAHRFPERDKPQTQDLGAQTRAFNIQAYLIGDDYLDQLARLEDALNAKGAGILVHPYRGEILVRVFGKYTVDHDTREGGMCRLTIPFLETEDTVYPSPVVQTQSDSQARVDAGIAAATTQFTDRFSLDQQPSFVSDHAIEVIGGFADQVDELARRISTLPEQAADLVAAVEHLSESAASLLLAPVELAGAITQLVARLRASAARPEAALEVLQELFGFGEGLDVIPTTTPTRVQQSENQAALVDLVRNAAVLEAARNAAQTDFESRDQALAVRDALIDQFELAEEGATSNEAYIALSAARAAMSIDINTRAADLARIAIVRLQEEVPALVLAYDLYGDPTRADEIVARNGLSDPLFVPAGVDLEVLIDG